MKRENSCPRLLIVAAILVMTFVWLISIYSKTSQYAHADIQEKAYFQMQQCMNAVKQYKAGLNIPIFSYDVCQTGMLGEEFNGITTTMGSLEAKRTTADPNMAALVVRMLADAGIKEGDVVCANFSGSFPSLNIAVITACDAMDVQLAYITSVGSSTYGANNPQLTFPEIADRLFQDGLISSNSVMVTAGGDGDVGLGMDSELLSQIKSRISQRGLNWFEQSQYRNNIEAKKALLDHFRPDCFVSVGGNISSLGIGIGSDNHPQGVIAPIVDMKIIDEKSGLIDRYLAEGIPVVNLLNIKKITAEYAMPFDTMAIEPIGKSPVFHSVGFNRIGIIFSFLLTLSLIMVHTLRRYKSLIFAKRESENMLYETDR